MTDDVERQVLVTGAGAAGLALATFLRMQGLDPVVVDRSESDARANVGLTLWSNGLSMLDHLGVADDVRAAATVVTRFETRTADGSVVDARSLPYGDARPFVTVREDRLRGLLRDRLPGGAVRTGTAVEALRDVDDAVEVRFEGGVREQFDVVVATRRRQSPARDRVREPATGRETTAWRLPVDVPAGTPDALTEIRGTDARFLFAPFAEDGAGSPPTDGFGYLSTESSLPDRAAGRIEALRAAVDDVRWLLPSVFDRLDDAGLVPMDAPDAQPGRLTAGRIALVGDAARAPLPTPGAGASLALEDAFVLTDELLTRPVPASLRHYAERRRDRLVRFRRVAGVTPTAGSTETAILDRVRRFLSAHDELMAQFYARQRRPLSRDVLDGR
jgi:2-polyprenyl-6-methoxyphenol hydroxylase-like FAD-dependent oxidoreductase